MKRDLRSIARFGVAAMLALAMASCGDDDDPTPIEPGDQVPAAPANLRCDAVDDNSMQLTWDDLSTNEEGFKVYRSETSGEEGALIATLAADVEIHVDESLADTTTFFYRVHSYNDDGQSTEFAQESATTFRKGPVPPTDLVLSDVNDCSITLTWVDQSTNETSFNIYRQGPGDSQPVLLRSVNKLAESGTNGTLRDDGLIASSSYRYIVRADSAGISSRLGAEAMGATLASSGEFACITRFAGTGTASKGAAGLPPLMTGLYTPTEIEFGPDGTPYILDWNNHRILSIENSVGKTVMAGGEDIGDGSGTNPDSIFLNHPTHISFDGDGRLVISAWHNSKVMRLDRVANFVETLSGDGSRGVFAGDGGPAIDAKLDLPLATVVDAVGNIYILDSANQVVRKIDALTQIITTVIGTGRQAGYAGDGGPGLLAKLSLPAGQMGDPAGRMAIGPNGHLYIADSGNNVIREWDPVADIIRTVAGNNIKGSTGDGGPATAASLNRPSDVALDADGNLYIADLNNSAIRKVDAGGTITTFAGQLGVSGNSGDGGPPAQARLARPYGVSVDADGNVYIADTINNVIRVVRK